MTTPDVDRAGAPVALPVLRFFDFEGLVELLETATLPFERWIDDADEAGSFLYRRLPDALIHAAAQPPAPRRGRLERWWAEKEREGEMATVLEQIRAFRPPEVAWVDRWYAETAANAALWQLQAAAGRGIAVRSTVGRLSAAIQPAADATITVERVVYGALARDAGAAPAVLRGRSEDAFQHEVRAVLGHGTQATVFTQPTLAVGADLRALSEAIVLADGSAERRQSLIRRLLERYGLDVPCGRPLAMLPAPAPLPMVVEQA